MDGRGAERKQAKLWFFREFSLGDKSRKVRKREADGRDNADEELKMKLFFQGWIWVASRLARGGSVDWRERKEAPEYQPSPIRNHVCFLASNLLLLHTLRRFRRRSRPSTVWGDSFRGPAANYRLAMTKYEIHLPFILKLCDWIGWMTSGWTEGWFLPWWVIYPRLPLPGMGINIQLTIYTFHLPIYLSPSLI